MARTTGPRIRPIPAAQIALWQRVGKRQSTEAHEDASREIRAELQARGIEVFSDAHYAVGSTGKVIGEGRSLKFDGSVTTHRALNLETMAWSLVELTTDKGTRDLHRNHPELHELGFDTDRGEPEGVPRVSAAALE